MGRHTSEQELRQFIRERDEALLSLDRKKILTYAKKYGAIIPVDEELFWISVHKARTALASLPEAERKKSLDWLSERGYGPFGSSFSKLK